MSAGERSTLQEPTNLHAAGSLRALCLAWPAARGQPNAARISNNRNETHSQLRQKRNDAQRRFRALPHSPREQSARAVIALYPVVLPHVFDTNLGAGARRMHEPVVAEVNANVRKGVPHGVEEDEIAGLQFVSVNDRSDFALLARRAREQDADRFLENQLHETAAIKTCIGIRATETVIDANQLKTLENQVLCTVGVAFEQREFVGGLSLFASVDMAGP